MVVSAVWSPQFVRNQRSRGGEAGKESWVWCARGIGKSWSEEIVCGVGCQCETHFTFVTIVIASVHCVAWLFIEQRGQEEGVG